MNVIKRALVSKNNIGKHLIFIVILLLATALSFVSGLLQGKELLFTICLFIVLWVLRNTLNQYKNLFTNILLSLFVVWVSTSTIDLGYHLYQIYSPKPPGERLESDVETIFKYRPNQVIYDSARYGDLAEMGKLTRECPQTRKIICQIDELGYRNPTGQKNKKNKVLLIGDSFGFGAMTDGENIADYLRKDGMETYNLSLPGYGPWQEFYTLRQEVDKINKADTCTVVWLLFTGNDLAGRFDSVNVADRKTNWRDDFYIFRKKSPLRTSFLEIVNPKALADKGVGVVAFKRKQDTALYYKPYLQQAVLDSNAVVKHKNYSKIVEVINKTRQLVESKKMRLIITTIEPKETFLAPNFGYKYSFPSGFSKAVAAYCQAKNIVFSMGSVYICFSINGLYLTTDTHLTAGGNETIAWDIETASHFYNKFYKN